MRPAYQFDPLRVETPAQKNFRECWFATWRLWVSRPLPSKVVGGLIYWTKLRPRIFVIVPASWGTA